MQKQIAKALLLFSVFLISPKLANAAILFETNFDNYTWNTTGSLDGTECGQTTGTNAGCSQAPSGFTNYRSIPSGSAVPWSSVSTLPSSKTDHTTGATSGHAFIARYDTTNYVGDSAISIMFPSQYKELYIQMWMKTQAFATNPAENSKTFRVMGIIPGCNNFYSYFSGGCADAIAFNDVGTFGTAAPNVSAWTPSFRCGPKATNYSCSGNIKNYDLATARLCGDLNCTDLSTAAGQWNDGAWHRLTMHVRMNDIGSNNGIYDATYDGKQEILHSGVSTPLTNLNYILSGAGITGWNAVSLGGNAYNMAGPGWIAYDDFVVSTSPIPADYVPGKSSSVTTTTTTPTTPTTPTTTTAPATPTGSFTIGETNILSTNESGYINNLVANSVSLSQAATIQSISLYAATAAGKVRLGIYDATGSGGGPGVLKASTNEITVVNGWNTVNVTTPVSLAAGSYWLTLLSDSDALNLKVTNTGAARFSAYTYGGLPTTFPVAQTSATGHGSVYATFTNTSTSANVTTASYSISDILTLGDNWLKTGTVSDVNADNIANMRDLGIMMSKWK